MLIITAAYFIKTVNKQGFVVKPVNVVAALM